MSPEDSRCRALDPCAQGLLSREGGNVDASVSVPGRAWRGLKSGARAL